MLNCYIFARNLETGGILSTMIFIKKNAWQLMFCVPTVDYLYNLQMIIVKHFSVDLIEIEFRTK